MICTIAGAPCPLAGGDPECEACDTAERPTLPELPADECDNVGEQSEREGRGPGGEYHPPYKTTPVKKVAENPQGEAGGLPPRVRPV